MSAQFNPNGRMESKPYASNSEQPAANTNYVITGIETAPAGVLVDGGRVGSETVLKTDLLARAYPRDGPMQSDMSDYREVVEPDLGLEERTLLNAAREARMTGDALSSTNLNNVVATGREFLGALADLLQQCSQAPPVEDMALQSRGARHVPSHLCLGTVNMAAGLLQAAMNVLMGILQLIESNMAIVNVLVWIVVLEVWHIISGWFTDVGLPSITRLLQGFTSLFLLRCYFALVSRTYAPEIKRPALCALRRSVVSVLEGIRHPASKRPAVLSVILVVRVTLLLQILYNSWLSVLLDRMEEVQGLFR